MSLKARGSPMWVPQIRHHCNQQQWMFVNFKKIFCFSLAYIPSSAHIFVHSIPMCPIPYKKANIFNSSKCTDCKSHQRWWKLPKKQLTKVNREKCTKCLITNYDPLFLCKPLLLRVILGLDDMEQCDIEQHLVPVVPAVEGSVTRIIV